MEPLENPVKTLFLLFYEVWRFCEGHCNNGDAKMLFKSATILEKTYLKLEGVGSLLSFENKLKEFWIFKGLPLVPLLYFKDSSLSVITKYMTDSKFTDFDVNLAVEQFLSYKSEKDFHALVKRLHETHKIVESLKENPDSALNSIIDYNAEICLSNLIKTITNSNINTNEAALLISQMIRSNNENVGVLLKVLCFPQDSEITALVQSLIAHAICNFLKGSTNAIAYSYLLKQNNKDFEQVITTWECFPELILKLIEGSIARFKCEYTCHTYSWECLYDGMFSFEDIISLVNKFKHVPIVKDQLMQLCNLRKDGSSLIIEDLLRICKIEESRLQVGITRSERG